MCNPLNWQNCLFFKYFGKNITFILSFNSVIHSMNESKYRWINDDFIKKLQLIILCINCYLKCEYIHITYVHDKRVHSFNNLIHSIYNSITIVYTIFFLKVIAHITIKTFKWYTCYYHIKLNALLGVKKQLEKSNSLLWATKVKEFKTLLTELLYYFISAINHKWKDRIEHILKYTL